MLEAEDGERAEGAVDMQPEPLLGGDLGQRREIVDRPGVDRAGGRDDAERLAAEAPVGGDRPPQLGGVHAIVGADPDRAQGAAAEPEQLEGAGDAGVRLARGVADQTRRGRGDAIDPDLAAGQMMARDGEPDQRRHRGAADQEAARGLRQAEQLAAPRRSPGARRRSRRDRDRRDWRSWSRPGSRPRGCRRCPSRGPSRRSADGCCRWRRAGSQRSASAAVASAPWPSCGSGAAERLLDALRQGLPDRPLAHRAQVIERLVEQPMGEPGEGVPIGRIERAVRRSWHWHLAEVGPGVFRLPRR